jgi:hypothetical protein
MPRVVRLEPARKVLGVLYLNFAASVSERGNYLTLRPLIEKDHGEKRQLRSRVVGGEYLDLS